LTGYTCVPQVSTSVCAASTNVNRPPSTSSAPKNTVLLEWLKLVSTINVLHDLLVAYGDRGAFTTEGGNVQHSSKQAYQSLLKLYGMGFPPAGEPLPMAQRAAAALAFLTGRATVSKILGYVRFSCVQLSCSMRNG
jgi:hypothetical protein